MAASGFRWIRPPSMLANALVEWERKVLEAVHEVARYFAPVLEDYAKAHAPWHDRTGNARQSLFSLSELGETIVKLYLSHGVEYGIYLELRYGGRYAIIMPTLQAHYGAVLSMLQGIFG